MKPKFSKQKLSWTKGRTVALHGNRLSYNASVQRRYEKSIMNLVEKMTGETEKRIIDLFKGRVATKYFKSQKLIASMDDSIYNMSKSLVNELTKKFEKLFNDNARPIASKMMDDSNNASTTSLSSSLKQLTGITISADYIPKALKQTTMSSIEENVKLIKSIPSKYFSDISQSVMRSIATGNGMNDLVDDIEKYTEQTRRRVKNIALDQTRKAYNHINKHRMMAVGYKKFKWLHSGGGQHPRASHQAMSGKIYSFSDLPVINKEQVERGYEEPERGIPGQAINCGCTMTPVYEFNSDE